MRILVIGGYGNFGRRLVESLVRYHNHDVVIAGRSRTKAEEFIASLRDQYHKTVGFIQLDVLTSDLVSLFHEVQPQIVVNASGPYQYQSSTSNNNSNNNSNYVVARACLSVASHYIDLADDRGFVTHFPGELNALAKEQGVMLVAGASTVPGLTGAILDHYQPSFSSIDTIDYGISPGNKTDRGEGTVASILSYVGKPFRGLNNGKQTVFYGWQGIRRYNFGYPLGKRWMGHCNIPDLELLPQRYPSLKTIRFQAGLEVSLLHIGLWFLSFFTRVGLVKNWIKYSRFITKISEYFIAWGSNSGGMFVHLHGVDESGAPKQVRWQLVAEDGVGPNVPTIPSELLINQIASGNAQPGARVCMGLFTLKEFFEIASRWGIYQKEIDHDQDSSQS